MDNKIELLAPAGDLEKLKMAILYGANAVFVGAFGFSLRSRASNFSFDELKEGVIFAHKHDAKIYVTTNILPHNNDLLGLVDFLENLEACNIDAIITSSLAIFETAKKHTNLQIHISTQQSITNSKAAQFFEELGASRLILARELDLSDLSSIRRNVGVELEVFIHGGVCTAYSGRCMLSNNMTKRDSNRGGCAHSCRWNYNLYKDAKKLELGNTFMTISQKDLIGLSRVSELIDLGINSLKIEGRMKSLHYIATIVGVYRRAIDAYYNKEIINLDMLQTELKKAENRQTSAGWLDGMTKSEDYLYGFRSEIPTQIFVGIIKGYDKVNKKALVEVRNHFKPNIKMEVFGPKLVSTTFMINDITDEKGEVLDAARHPHQLVYIDCPFEVNEYDLLRLVLE